MREDILAPYGDFTAESLAALNLRRADAVEVFSEENKHSFKRLTEDLEQAHLGVYTTDLGQILLGVDETVPDLHPHERWRCIRLNTAHTWHYIEHHFGSLSNAMLASAVADNAHMNIRRAARNGIGGMAAILEHWRNISYSFTNVAEEVARVNETTTLDPIQWHELIFDVALWREHNPEFKDMPGDLLWRMHGLGKAAEYARENRRGGEDEDAFL